MSTVGTLLLHSLTHLLTHSHTHSLYLYSIVDLHSEFNYIGPVGTADSSDINIKIVSVDWWVRLVTDVAIGIEQVLVLSYKHVVQKLSRSFSDLAVEFGLSIFLLLVTLLLIGVDMSGGMYGKTPSFTLTLASSHTYSLTLTCRSC